MNLLPCPRIVRRHGGHYVLPGYGVMHLGADLPTEVLLPIASRLRERAAAIGVQLELIAGPVRHPRLVIRAEKLAHAAGAGDQSRSEWYRIQVTARGTGIQYREVPGLRAAVATLRQLFAEYGRRLPGMTIEDWPDFPVRGVMLDVSRGRVPNLATLKHLLGHLADFKINQFQLYLEHTFAYRNYESAWSAWGALTPQDLLELDAYCHMLGIELVPNQNSFGHLRYLLEHLRLKHLAEVAEPYAGTGGAFLRYPTTLAPNHPGTMPFLRGLYDELLPCFTSEHFNVGCDETWDLGRGESSRLCEKKGKGRVYLDFLLKIHREVTGRGRRMMFWGDIILNHPELIRELPRDVIALNWGYEADHPFAQEAALFSRSRIPFYVCPGTSTWMTLIGRHDNALANLSSAAKAGKRFGAVGYLNTDWGDGGHPQPLAVSFIPYAAGAALGWCADTWTEKLLAPVLSRDVFCDPTGRAAEAAFELGMAHLKLGYSAPNVTPLGATIAAPPPRMRELVCRDGLKYYVRIKASSVRATLAAVEHSLKKLRSAQPGSPSATVLVAELDMAGRMAAESCHLMLWQQALADGRNGEVRKMASRAIKRLSQLDAEFSKQWPARNKGTPIKCSAFLKWRIGDYRRAKLHFSPEEAARDGLRLRARLRFGGKTGSS